jgi:hypothetical protein
MIDLLANDARKLAELRGILHDQVRAAEKFVKDYCRYYNANKIPKGLLDVLADQFEIVVNKWIGRLDEVVRDLLQIVSAFISQRDRSLPTEGVCLGFHQRDTNLNSIGTECHASYICKHILFTIRILRCK